MQQLSRELTRWDNYILTYKFYLTSLRIGERLFKKSKFYSYEVETQNEILCDHSPIFSSYFPHRCFAKNYYSYKTMYQTRTQDAILAINMQFQRDRSKQKLATSPQRCERIPLL